MVVFTLASCKTLSVHQSQKPSNELVYSSYNSAYQLSWQVVNDDEFLTVHISTNYKPTQLKILRKGFTVAFNNDLKKKPAQRFIYPVIQNGSKNSQQRQTSTNGQGGRGQRRRMDLQKIVDRVSSDVILHKGDGIDSFSIHTLPAGFDVGLKVESEMLTLTYKFPLNEIFGSNGFSEPIAMGLISGSFDIPVNTNSGGRPSGGAPNRNMAELADPVKIWFKVIPVKNS